MGVIREVRARFSVFCVEYVKGKTQLRGSPFGGKKEETDRAQNVLEERRAGYQKPKGGR